MALLWQLLLLGSLTHWIMAAFMTFCFSALTEFLDGGNTFMIFVGFMILQPFFVWKMTPETKGNRWSKWIVKC